MNIPIEEIINFHIKRTNCHVQTLNYFAQILGYHFPEHDSDKYKEPYIFGYAYCNYAKHHKGEFRPDRPDRPRFTKDYDGEFNSDRPARPHLKKDRQGRDIDRKRGPDPRILEKAKNAPQPKDSDKK